MSMLFDETPVQLLDKGIVFKTILYLAIKMSCIEDKKASFSTSTKILESVFVPEHNISKIFY